MMIFSGNATPKLAQEIADYLEAPLGRAVVSTFSDGETMVEILENVRGQDIFVVQSTCSPANNNLMELLTMADALRRASANRITAVIPYFGYARQDRRVRSARVPISAKIVADMMHSVGFSRLITVDLHADQIQGFFYMPVDNVYSTTCILEDIRQQNFSNPLIVSPDVGGVVRARAVAKRLNDTDLAIIDKRRPSPNESMVMNIIGDVRGRNCILIDDIIDTGGTLCSAAEALKNSGATTVTAYCTHPVLSGNAIEKINRSVIDQVIVSDTIPLSDEAQQCQRIRVVGLGNIIAETIYRICGDESVSEMFA